MLHTIRDDLREFCGTVRNDASEKVKVSSDLSNDLNEFYSDFESMTAKAVQQVKRDTTTVLDKLDNKLASELLIPWDYQDAVREAEFRRGIDETYRVSLLKPTNKETTSIEANDSTLEFEAAEIRTFLNSFEIKHMTELVVDTLDQYPATVKVHFEALVPVHVSYEDFWERYFFRCDVDRIVRIWTAKDERIRSARQAAMRTLKKTILKPMSLVVTPLKSAVTWGYKEIEPEAALEAEFRMAMEEIYRTPLLKSGLGVEGTEELEGLDLELEATETRLFLDTFDINQKTEEIVVLLDKHPDTLRARFEDLVPVQVSYEDFWERYFYRCDVNRIVRAWAAKDKQTREARNLAIGAWSQRLSTPVAMLTTPLTTAIGSLYKKLDSGASDCERNEDKFEEANGLPSVDLPRANVPSAEASIVDSTDKMLALRVKLDKTKKCLADAKERVNGLKTDLRAAQDSLRHKGQPNQDELPESISVRSSTVTADLTDSDGASDDDSLSSSNGGDMSSITESAYLSESHIVEKPSVRMDSKHRRLDEESLTDFEEEKEEHGKSPYSLMKKLKFDSSSFVKLAFTHSLWETKDNTVQG